MKYQVIPLLSLLALGTCCGCHVTPDYTEYLSDERYDLLRYADDNVTVDAYLSHRESPLNHDGIVGKVTDVCELYVHYAHTPQRVVASWGDKTGEMSFLSVKNCFYWCLGEVPTNLTELTLECDGTTTTLPIKSVLYDGVISTQTALACAREFAHERFEELSVRKLFDGELSVRLLYDEGCYYYVGLTTKDKKTVAWLVDGETGKVLAEHEDE